MAVGSYLGDGNPDGVSIGTATTEKVSIYGVTPVVQADAITAPLSTATTSTAPFGFVGSVQPEALVTAVRSIITALKNFGITA